MNLAKLDPIASATHAIVFAVNCPPHEPAEGMLLFQVHTNVFHQFYLN